MSSRTARATLLPATQRFAATALRPRSTSASESPIWRYSSSVRACTATARDVVAGSAVLSTILTRTPSRVSHRASTRPVGPAPTMRTSVSLLDDAFIGPTVAGVLPGRLKRTQLFATRLAEFPQRVHGAAVHHVPQLGEGLVRREIRVHDHSDDCFLLLDNERARCNAHSADESIHAYERGDFRLVVDKSIRVRFRRLYDEPEPLGLDPQPILKLGKRHHVNEDPYQPRHEPAHPNATGFQHREIPADHRHIPFVEVAKGTLGLPPLDLLGNQRALHSCSMI